MVNATTTQATNELVDESKKLKSAISDILGISDRAFDSIYAIASVLQTCLRQGGKIHAEALDALLETVRNQACTAQDLIFTTAEDVGVKDVRKFFLSGQVSIEMHPTSEAAND